MTTFSLEKTADAEQTDPAQAAKTLYRVSLLTDTLRNTARDLLWVKDVHSAVLALMSDRFDELRAAYIDLLPADEAGEAEQWLPKRLSRGWLSAAMIYDSAAVLATMIDVTLSGSAWAVGYRMNERKVVAAAEELAGTVVAGAYSQTGSAAQAPGQYL